MKYYRTTISVKTDDGYKLVGEYIWKPNPESEDPSIHATAVRQLLIDEFVSFEDFYFELEEDSNLEEIFLGKVKGIE